MGFNHAHQGFEIACDDKGEREARMHAVTLTVQTEGCIYIVYPSFMSKNVFEFAYGLSACFRMEWSRSARPDMMVRMLD